MSRTFVPLLADLPPNVDVREIVASMADDHVSAPAASEDALAAIAAKARAEGIDLSIVVIDKNPGHDSQLRDLATDVAKTEHGTVLVLSPDWVGTYSDTISRVRLEGAEDSAKWTGGQSAVAAQRFVDDLHTPSVSWSVVTGVLLALVTLAVAGLYLVKLRRAQA